MAPRARRKNRPIAYRFVAVLCVAASIFSGSHFVRAGGGPENVLLVVNANSTDSMTIANHYVAIRNIPPTNVVYIDWRGGHEECQGPQFWSRILKPALTAILERGLASQIDYIVYSSDIPWRVILQPLYPEEKFNRMFHPVASTTGATYLWKFIRDKNPAIVVPLTNWYVPPDSGDNEGRCQQLGNVDSRGFRARYVWDRNGQRIKDPTRGQTYYLSTVLGVTAGRGNSVEEVVSYLRRAAAADGTRPRGTIYFMKNKNVRSVTRHDCFDEVVEQLRQLDISARVVSGKIPQGAKDVLGITAGTARFDFAKSRSTILPGAICEHLTSSGGQLKRSAGQTPLTEFLRHGAAGASGTVSEPMALQFKFPLPTLHLHYARGCSLAESFYQSVAGPYQLLVVGDPLCQPWAVVPTVAIEGIERGQEVSGTLPIRASATTAESHRIGLNELFVDGRLVARYRPGHALKLNTEKLSDGYHELRVVAVDADPIEARGRSIVPIQVNNHGAKIEFSVAPQTEIATSGKLRITARQPGATAIIVRQNRREVARFKGESGEVELLAATLGSGPVVLQAESEGEYPTRSAPVRIEIQ